ncbi:MAG: ArnT family glycosyltransferase [Pyrinomonadaceae bacterium]
MHPSTLAKRGTVLLFLAIVAVYFYGLGNLPLVGPDEPRYAQVAREMFLRRDLITPTLGGHIWFEKPALLYWMMILSFKLFGVTEWAARLPAAISGVLTVAAVFVVGRSVERDEDPDNEIHGYAFWSALAAATTIGTLVFSRAASFDIVLTMTTTWALAFYVLYDLDESVSYHSDINAKLRRWVLVGFYSFIGLSLLAKGLVGIVIPLGVIGLYHLLQKRLPGRHLLISLVWGLPLALAVGATWYAPVIRRHGWPFIDQFFIQHHFARYVSNKYHHSQPVYYYLLVVPLLALPWTAFLIDGSLQLRSWLRRARTAVPDYADDRLNRLMVFALAWFLFPFVFFSFSNSKLPGYVLPILPAAALIVGRQLWRLGSDYRSWPLRTTASLYLLFVIVALAYSWRTGNLPTTFAVLAAAPLLTAGCFAFLLAHKPAASVLLLAGATVTVLIVTMSFAAPAFAERESSKRLLQLADARGYSQAAIYGMQRRDRTPEFYAAGRVVYGGDGEPVMYEGPAHVVDECRKRQDVLLAFVPIGEVSRLTGMASAQTEVIGNNARYAIVAVRAR